jgi:ATP phosphoribosyltransferase regulatory subunit
MVYQPPVGARDLLPLEVAQKRWIEERLQQVFHGWGYHQIITSTLERLDTLMAGGAVQPSTVFQLQNVDDEVLGLRPELTASIARAAATRMTTASHPQRLYYNANVFRRANLGNHNRRQEFYQAGVELLGANGVAADAEILLLLSDALNRLNLGQWHLVLGDAGLTRSLLSTFPENLREAVRTAIAHLDRLALEALPLSPDLKNQALTLIDLRGQPADVLQKVSTLNLNADQQAIVNNLKTLIELMHDYCADEHNRKNCPPAIVIDLSLVQTFDYYTGIVFEAVSSGDAGQYVLGQGGRYDQLLGLYNPKGISHPGIGFCLNIEDLQQVLLPIRQLPLQTPSSDYLVVPQTTDAHAAAFVYAQKLRSTEVGVRVEVDVEERNTPEDARRYASDRRIRQIVWVSATGALQVELL